MIFPQKSSCGLCGRELANHGADMFCQACLNQLVKIGKRICVRCGKEFAEGLLLGQINNKSCRECAGFAGSFSHARAVGYYTNFLREVLHYYKYVGKRPLAKGLAELMAAEIYRYPFYQRTQAVVPVPLYPRKLQERGFNQAELLAKELAKLLGLPLVDGLIRKKDTGIQSKLNKGERMENVAGAFSLAVEAKSREQLVGKRVLLIDDVMTTGATIHFAAQALLKGKVEEVLAFTLARGYSKE